MEDNDTVIDNITTDTEDNSSEYRMLHPFPTSSFILPLTVLIISSLSTNLLVISTWAKQSNLQTAPNLHIMSLAVSDCAVSILIMPVTALKITLNQK